MGDKEEDREAGRQRRLELAPVKHGKGLQAEKRSNRAACR